MSLQQRTGPNVLFGQVYLTMFYLLCTQKPKGHFCVKFNALNISII